jgi:hypothetical protein
MSSGASDNFVLVISPDPTESKDDSQNHAEFVQYGTTELYV